MAATKKTPRKRLSAKEAKDRILTVAERHLARVGPAGLRLKVIAEELGISHPAILHHFGHREGLVGAVLGRAVAAFETRLGGMLDGPVAAPNALLDALADFFAEDERARTLAWLTLSAEGGAGNVDTPFERLGRLFHARQPGGGGDDRDFSETLFRMQLASLALFAEALIGGSMRRMSGQVDDAAASQDFRRRLAQLLSAPIGETRAPGQP